MSNDPDKHAANLGKVMSNLQSLEFSLRAFLLEAESTQDAVDYQQLKVGDQIAEDAFGNWDTMGKLIAKYNSIIRPIDCSLCVDDSVVKLRDALAHGRVAAFSPSAHMQLLKFTKPRNRRVRVSFAAQMDKAWFQKQISLTLEQIKKVVAAGKRLGMNAFKNS